MQYKGVFLTVCMLYLLYGVSCDTFSVNSGSSTCCTACPEYSATSSPFVPNKLKVAIGNCISKNLTISYLANTLKSIHINYTNSFLAQMIDFDQRVNLGYASCPSDVTGTNQIPYSLVDNNTVNIFFDSIIDTIGNNSFSKSPNFVNTYANFVQQLEDLYNSVLANDLSSPTYITQEQIDITAQQVSTTLGMMLVSKNLNRFGPYQQKYQSWKYSQLTSLCFIDPINIHLCQRYSPVPLGDYSQSDFIPRGVKNISTSLLNQINYYRHATPQVLLNYLKPEFSAQNPYLLVDVYNVSLLNYVQGDVGIYDPTIQTSLMSLNFDGNVYTPSGEDLSTYPSNGFNVGQTATSIWAEIMAVVFAPYLYCYYGNVLPTLMASCPATCDRTC